MKIGVGVKDVNGRLYEILPIIESCVTAYGGGGSMITSTNEAKWRRFTARRNVLVVEIKRARNVSLVCGKLKGMLEPGYNIVKDHRRIRIKWGPKQRELF
ncbi:hypothetical protein ES703_11202 [subsurface metagenome]